MRYLPLLVTMLTIIVGQTQAKENQDMRYSHYGHISKHLETLNDSDISTLLEQGTSPHSGWGTTVKLEIDGIPVFVKQVPLNEIEGNLKNISSTVNLFGLPLYYFLEGI